MTWNVIQSAAIGATTNALTQAVSYGTNLSAGTKLICYIGASKGTSFTISSVKDGAGNSMTQCGFFDSTSAGASVAIYAMDTPSGDVGAKPTITVTFSATVGCSMVVQEVSGIPVGNTTAAMLDGTAQGDDFGAASSDAQPAYSSGAVGEYLVTIQTDNGGPQTATQPSGYTLDTHSVNANTGSNCAVAYKSSTGGAESGTWTFTGSTTATDLMVVAFQVVASGTPIALADSGGGTDAIAIVSTGTITPVQVVATSWMTSGGSATLTVHLAITNTAGNPLIVPFTFFNYTNGNLPHVTSLSDPAGNNWVYAPAAPSQNPPTGGSYVSGVGAGVSGIAYCLNPAAIGGGNVTIVVTATSSTDVEGQFAIQEWPARGWVYDTSASSSTSSTSNPYTGVPVTLSGPQDIVTVNSAGSNDFSSVSSPFTFPVNGPPYDGNYSGTPTVTWTVTGPGGTTTSSEILALKISSVVAQSVIQTPYKPIAPPPGPVSQVVGNGAQSLLFAESATGTDAFAGSFLLSLLFDAASATDVFTGVDLAPLTDGGTGTDALSILFAEALTDSGSGTDAAGMGMTFVPAESPGGTDVIVIAIFVVLNDGISASTADVMAITGTILYGFTDSGSGTDALAITQATALADGGTGTDVTTPQLAETVTSTQALTIAMPALLADGGAGADTEAIAGTISPSWTDGGTGTDSSFLIGGTFGFNLTDGGTMDDVLGALSESLLLSTTGQLITSHENLAMQSTQWFTPTAPASLANRLSLPAQSAAPATAVPNRYIVVSATPASASAEDAMLGTYVVSQDGTTAEGFSTETG